MADILIKGLEMPKEGAVDISIKADGTITSAHYRFDLPYKAIEVKPHGRCIDADELYKIVDVMNKCSMSKVMEYILDAPTILEAST